MSTQPYPEGLDCVWLASDRDGHLGAFITAGVGPIPLTVLDSACMPVDDIEGHLCRLPPVSRARLLVSVERADDFIELARRGVFVYDWTDVHRSTRAELRVYEPVAVPTHPITVRSLAPDLARLAQASRFTDVAFAAGEAVDVRAHFGCDEVA
jgi:hypothetical protein